MAKVVEWARLDGYSHIYERTDGSSLMCGVPGDITRYFTRRANAALGAVSRLQFTWKRAKSVRRKRYRALALQSRYNPRRRGVRAVRAAGSYTIGKVVETGRVWTAV